MLLPTSQPDALLKVSASDADRTGVNSHRIQHRHDARTLRDRGSIVAGWLVKLTLILAVIVVVGYDVLAVTYNNVRTTENARAIAQEASSALYLRNAGYKQASLAAEAKAAALEMSLNPDDLIFHPDGSIEVTISSDVQTIAAHRIGPLEEYATAVETFRTPARP